MDVVQLQGKAWAHSSWADAALAEALRAAAAPESAWREYAHLLAAEAVWLARLERRPAPVAIWPALDPAAIETLRREVQAGYARYLAGLSAELLDSVVTYSNSVGQEFETAVADILLHVALHGQYHRGRINLLLRQSDALPAPVDYIAFVRGIPPAVTRVDAPP